MTLGSCPKRICRGFTTIELIATLGVTIVVAALGASAYRTYTVRKQVMTGLALAAGLQERVAIAFRRSGIPPLDWRAAGFPVEGSDLRGEYVERIEIDRGRIEIVFGGAADAALAKKTLSLTPFETANTEIVWICGNQRPGVGLKPLGFTGGAPQPIQVPTTIDARYLPPMCY